MTQHLEKLRYNWEFQNGYQNGKKYWNRFFVIYVSANRFNSVRLGITVSKRTGGSVQRNRIKRLIRESFRFIKCKLRKGYDIIVIGRRPAFQLKCQQAQAELRYLFRRARLFIKWSLYQYYLLNYINPWFRLSSHRFVGFVPHVQSIQFKLLLNTGFLKVGGSHWNDYVGAIRIIEVVTTLWYDLCCIPFSSYAESTVF